MTEHVCDGALLVVIKPVYFWAIIGMCAIACAVNVWWIVERLRLAQAERELSAVK